MDPTLSNEAVEAPEPESDGANASVCEKRSIENGESDVKLAKRQKSGAGEMRRVAEIVLVLSAMAGMRGGKSPTDTELKLMAEARAKLVGVCQDLAPKDLVARDAVFTVIDDLGLNWKAKDQRLGCRGSRLSIKEKVSLAKRKMEDPKKFVVPSVAYTSQTSQPNFGAVPENRGQLHTIRMLPSDKPCNNAPLSSGAFSASSPTVHVPAATSTPLTQPPTEIRAGLPSSHVGRDSSGSSFPKAEKTQFVSEGVSNGTTYAPQVQAYASANHPLVNTPTWSLQPHSTSLGKSASENKVPNYFAKVEGAVDMGVPLTSSQTARDQAFRSLTAQAGSASLPNTHPPTQGVKYAQHSSFFNNHNEIAKIVQKVLQTKLPEHPTWTPPSREYMNKALTCQMCELTINEVESVVLCDACEKGFHLKCLEAVNQKGIPRGEWHCMKCTALSNGKPLPPKYGRVMRSMTPPKGPSNPAGGQSPLEKKLGTADPKVGQGKIITNGSSGLQNPSGSGTVGSSNTESTSDSKIPNEIEMPGNGVTSSGKDVDQGMPVETIPNNSTEKSILQTQLSKLPAQEKGSISKSKLQPPAFLSDKIDNKFEDSKPSQFSQDVQEEPSYSAEAPLKTCQEHCISEESDTVRETNDCGSGLYVKQSEQDIVHANSVGSSEPDNSASEQAGPSGGFQNVAWVGNVLQLVDEKNFYESCCVGGITYKVQDHALLHSTHGKIIPSKLQAMWEDIKTGSKWILVNQCYFPGDLPEAVGHPCAPESNEVYESNHESSVMAGLIQGPCEVLPPTKFKEKNERTSQLRTEANSGSNPLFLCKWFYDEVKGNFRPV